jgi:hypothetical protein
MDGKPPLPIQSETLDELLAEGWTGDGSKPLDRRPAVIEATLALNKSARSLVSAI